MNTSLVIMAAGIGSRFGQGIKQLAHAGPCGEIVMEYSVHDAIVSGFNKIIFVIRKDIEADFREIIAERVEEAAEKAGVKLEYAFQDISDVPEGKSVPDGRTKPWGTGQAVLAARDFIREPFAVINADDYYGKEAFRKVHDFLAENRNIRTCCMAGFRIGNTLSDSGTVTRGICMTDDKGYLTDIAETSGIRKTENGAEAGGKVFPADTEVSMNMWGFPEEFLPKLKDGFGRFFDFGDKDPMKAEYLLPVLVGELLKDGDIQVKVLPTHDRWLGMTYREDIPAVRAGFAKMAREGVYSPGLFDDI